MKVLDSKTLKFLKDLSKNNNREWFHDNKKRYEIGLADAKTFQADFTERFKSVDDIEDTKLYRIYRDVRFSKDKTPYNPSFRMSWTRRKPHLRGGYFLAMGHDEVFIGGGFWQPNKEDLAHIRSQIAAEPQELRKILKSKKFKAMWGELKGDQLKTAPRGYEKDHPAVDLLRYKQYLLYKTFSAKAATEAGFSDLLLEHYQGMRPLFNYMSYILGHDLNGVPLHED